MLLQGKRVACLVGDDYEDLEVWYPALSDKGMAEVKATDCDALIVPGGWMPDKLRRSPAVLSFCQEFDRAGKVQEQ